MSLFYLTDVTITVLARSLILLLPEYFSQIFGWFNGNMRLGFAYEGTHKYSYCADRNSLKYFKLLMVYTCFSV